MQFLLSGSGILFILTIIGPVQFIDADKIVVVAFNNDIAPSSTQTCSSDDNGKIDNVFHWASLSRSLRHLKSSSRIMPNETSILDPINFYRDEKESRELATFSSRCKNACAGYKTGTCRAIGCVGYRRTLTSTESDDEKGEIQDAVCDRSINSINDGLNKLISTNAISDFCKSFIDASRRVYTCYDETIYGQIDTLIFWDVGDASSPSLMTTVSWSSIPYTTTSPAFNSAFSFCSSQKITVELN
jgi:hypothetical protein